MTRQFRILNMAEDGSEQSLFVYQLTDNCKHPTPIAPGREMIASIHDNNEAVIITKRQLKDIEHPMFDIPITGASSGKPDPRDAELYNLRANVERLEQEKARGWAGDANNLTDEQRQLLKDMGAADAAAGGHPPRAMDPMHTAGTSLNQGTGEQLRTDVNANTPTQINDAGDTKPTDPNADAPGGNAKAAERAAIDAEEKQRDAATQAVNPGTQGERAPDGAMDGGTGPNTVEPEAWKPYDKRTKAELQEQAGRDGVQIEDGATKDEMVAAMQDADDKRLAKMTKAELVEEAKRRGVEINEKDTKSDLIADINKAS